MFLRENISDENTDVYYDYFAHEDELDSKRTLISESPTTPSIILDPPPRGLTQGRGIKILPRK